MDTEKILELFKNYMGDKINLHGLIVTPISIEPSFKFRDAYNIYFNLNNPNGVSYFTEIVLNEIDDDVQSFQSMINEHLFVQFTPKTKQGLYLDKKLQEKIQNAFNSVKVIEFTTGTPFVGYQRYKLFIESVGLSIHFWDSDSFGLYNNVKVKRAEKNGERHDPRSAVREYTEVFLPDEETYYETENLYSQIDYILNDYPLLTDRWSHIASYYDTKFIQ